MSNNIYFISGHLDLTAYEFVQHYIPLIDQALKEKDASFVVGDYRGGDNMAQLYLTGRTNNVTVYHMFKSPRHNAGNFKTKGGFKSDTERDSQMTRDSTIDIAWIRPGKEKSGTARNLKRHHQI